ncbi:MAG TPA: BPTI/Kunitz domain-containing protein [Polyangiaceae bacterium]|nr:BPTI/Kunitz domain-containing protein [Polyangiaceae bacterium]
MSRSLTFVRIAAASSLVVLLAGACGGQSFSSTDGDDDGGTSAGGTSSIAGKGSGGSTRAGTSAGGSSSAGTSSAGAAGSNPGDLCSLPPMPPGSGPGGCTAYFTNWYHEATTGICTPWVYGGCGGTGNNFQSLEECQRACPQRAPNYDACQQPTDCLVTSPGCCGICDGPNITAHDLIAYNRQYGGLPTCGGVALIAAPGEPGPGVPAPIACEPCQPAPDGTLKHFMPTCVQGECGVEDLRKSPTTACQIDDDCRLRNGTGCCEGCTPENVIAVRNDGSFEKLACGDLPVGCPDCAALPPEGALAKCVEGHCTVVYFATTGP